MIRSLARGIDVKAGTSENTVFIVNTEKLGQRYPFNGLKVYLVDVQSVALDAIGRDIPNPAKLGNLTGAGIMRGA
jgi:hypothetical protein